MYEPALEVGRRFVETHQPAGRVLLCAVTGSHHYGFASADSDLDLKGIYLAPTSQILGLDDPEETRDRMQWSEGVECDLTLHEARKALRLLLGGNGNMLERILSPHQLFETPELAELRALLPSCLSRRFQRHYAGYFRGQVNEHVKSATPRAKTLLYSYRVALTGTHLMRTGELLVDLNQSAVEYGFTGIVPAIELKRAGGEKAELPADLDLELRREWPRLEEMIAGSVSASPLPESPAGQSSLCNLLQRMRMDNMG
jgi:hypothetical protein